MKRMMTVVPCSTQSVGGHFECFETQNYVQGQKTARRDKMQGLQARCALCTDVICTEHRCLTTAKLPVTVGKAAVHSKPKLWHT